jgi:hypothetical protein
VERIIGKNLSILKSVVYAIMSYIRERRNNMGEAAYMKPEYCLECAGKHSNRLEHHFEDMVTATENNPDLRQEAQEMLDNIRQMRKKVDELRIKEMARKKLEEGGI